MTVYLIDPKSNIDSNNILNIMTQLIYDISNSISNLYSIVNQSIYIKALANINQILNNYLKIYNFFYMGITNIYIQIYNQNINLVIEVRIKIIPYKYTNTNSQWSKFITNQYYEEEKIIYSQLNNMEKNDLRYSIISRKLYFLDNINFIYLNKNTTGIIFKPIYTHCDCEYNEQNNQYCYISTLYWN